VTAALVGLKSRAAVFVVQRWVAEYEGEPLLAVLPGVALDELWEVVGVGEQALQAMSGLVAVVSLASLVAVVLAGLNERRRELAVLRAVGAGRGMCWACWRSRARWSPAWARWPARWAASGLVALAGPWLQTRSASRCRLGADRSRPVGLWAAIAGRGYACRPDARRARLPPVAGRRPVATELTAMNLRSHPDPAVRPAWPRPLAAGPGPARRAHAAPPLGGGSSAPRPATAPAAKPADRSSGFPRDQVGRTGAQGLGPDEGAQGPALGRPVRRRPARDRRC
jgi:hypothetical protein